MACEEHKDLANKIKGTHLGLRNAAREHGFEAAWSSHVRDKKKLEEYAAAMHRLATEYWEERNANSSRINWIVNQCNQYFKCGGLVEAKQREQELHRLYFNEELVISDNCGSNGEKVCLLDVGSCYNPFKEFSVFDDVVAIDLAPAIDSVLKCDFLAVEVAYDLPLSIVRTETPCTLLPANTFDVIAFSLFIEYLPCKKQRWMSCLKAYQLLKSNGLLIIITPDSKHASANAKLIRNWRLALASLGLKLLKCEKHPHLHCLVYRKCFNKKLTTHWLSLQKNVDDSFNPSDMITIPQDFTKLDEPINNYSETVELNRDSIVDDFSQMISLDFEIDSEYEQE